MNRKGKKWDQLVLCIILAFVDVVLFPSLAICSQAEIGDVMQVYIFLGISLIFPLMSRECWLFSVPHSINHFLTYSHDHIKYSCWFIISSWGLWCSFPCRTFLLPNLMEWVSRINTLIYRNANPAQQKNTGIKHLPLYYY